MVSAMGRAVGHGAGLGGPLYSLPPPPLSVTPLPPVPLPVPAPPGSPPMRCPNGGHPPWSLGKEGGRKGAECCHTARTSRPWVPPSPGRRRGEHRGDNGAGWGGGGWEGRSEARTRELSAESAALCSLRHLAAARRGAQAHAQQRRARRGGR